MVYSNVAQDLYLTKRMESVMDQLYRKLGWKVIRFKKKKVWDFKGVDLMLQTSPIQSSKMWVDEKIAIKYWNRDLNSFCCELSSNVNPNRYGWFAKECDKINTHYIFVWIRAKDEALQDITQVEFVLIDKNDLLKYFAIESGFGERDTIQTVDSLMVKENYWKYSINEMLYLKRSNISPEFPINAIFSKKFLKAISVSKKIFTENDLRCILQNM